MFDSLEYFREQLEQTVLFQRETTGLLVVVGLNFHPLIGCGKKQKVRFRVHLLDFSDWGRNLSPKDSR